MNIPFIPFGGISFSPNSRFLYACNFNEVYQYDTWAIDVAGSIDTVAKLDTSSAHHSANYEEAQLAPDGKIYINSGCHYKLSVIDYPDRKGDSCSLRQYGLEVPSFFCGVPYYPNYRLGATTCYGLGVQEIRAVSCRLYPNPTQQQLTIDYGNLNWEASHEVELRVTDLLGRTVYAAELPEYSGIHQLSTAGWPWGVYACTILQGGVPVWSGRVVKSE